MLMELVEGDTLEKLLHRGPIPMRNALDYVSQVLGGLGYAHDRGVIHRDIKPANMMLTTGGTVKLMDFGIAKTADRQLTMTGVTVGSLYYMSPEQINGTKDLDARSDLYSLGVSLYEIVTRKRPFDGDSQFAIMAAHLEKLPVLPTALDPSVPPILSDVILVSIAKDPAQRFQSAQEFAAALDRVRQSLGMPVAAATSVPGAQRSVAYTPIAQAETVALQTPTPAPKRSGRSLRVWAASVGLAVIALCGFLWWWTHRPPPASVTLSSGDMVLVEGGQALLQADLRPIPVDSFYIDKNEVTNRAYLLFCRETGSTIPEGAGDAPAGNPVVNVSFDDAQSFARWAKKRLPTAFEWEKAARGSKGQAYPWGNELRYEFVNLPRDAASAKSAAIAEVTSHPEGASPYGALNMLGNAWEWVDARTPAPSDAEFSRYATTFKLTPALSPSEPFYQIRGGSYRYFVQNVAALLYDSSPAPARARKPDIGFRCARDVQR
jgi:serine/threonine-protein kinase